VGTRSFCQSAKMGPRFLATLEANWREPEVIQGGGVEGREVGKSLVARRWFVDGGGEGGDFSRAVRPWGKKAWGMAKEGTGIRLRKNPPERRALT